MALGLSDSVPGPRLSGENITEVPDIGMPIFDMNVRTRIILIIDIAFMQSLRRAQT